ncbi:MAG: HIT domain-containing protein [Chloroflexota bacterium]|nr:HIT domain-containing protein [Chloroflexota bacterium]MDE2947195.1 HIT domain-containing protein [Chloroflexota bacterium]
MNPIWTPWRMEYIRGERKRFESCLFCRLAETADNDRAQHVVSRSSHTYAALNRYPYTYAHTMIIPYEHVSSQEDMSAAALADLMLMTNRTMRVLREIADPPAFNIGANIGAAAGASIAAHFHFHIVPRWNGDHNFMQCIGGTRTVPDTLDNILEQMRSSWDSLYGPKQEVES